MGSIVADIRHALRIYGRTPVASALVILVLAIAMAFVAALLSLYVDLLIKPHPGFDEGSGVVTFGWTDGQNAGGIPLELIERLADEAATLDASAGTVPTSFNVGSEREELIGEIVTREFFDGVRPRIVLGRGILPEEHDGGGAMVTVISYRLWQQRFGGRDDAIGEALPILGRAADGEGELHDFRVVGVMTPDFTGTLPPQNNLETDLWLPVEQAVPTLLGMTMESVRGAALRGIGRRASGASWQVILDELNARFIDDLPNFTLRPTTQFEVLDGLVFNAPVQRATERQLKLMLVASVLLALVAAANVSLFLLARAPGRRRELGIRMAVGAPLKRLSRQLATEAGLLVAVAALFGLALSVWLAEFLRGLSFLEAAQWRDVTLLDWRVLGLVGIFLLVLALAVSLAPILGLKRLGIAASSRQVAARATVAQRIAGTAQIAIAGALGGAAIAFAWYLAALVYSDPGYQTRNVYAAVMAVDPATVAQNVEAGQAAIPVVDNSRRRDAILSLPGVTDASMTGIAPGVQAGVGRNGVPHPDDPTQQIPVVTAAIDSHFIDILQPQLLYGRAPTDNDAGVALVNQTLARQFFGRDDVVGESLPIASPGSERAEIIGVLEDLSFQHPEADIEATALMTSVSGFFVSFIALIESASSNSDLRDQLQGLIDSGELELSLQDLRPLETVRLDMIAADRARSFLTIGTATLVVLLAAFGFYGTQRYLVTAGRREYAVRASLGAGPKALGRLVLWRGLLLGLPGLLLSLPLAFIVVALLRGDYVSEDVSPFVVTLGVVVGLIALLTAASFGPARQARSTQPAPLLKEE